MCVSPLSMPIHRKVVQKDELLANNLKKKLTKMKLDQRDQFLYMS